MILAHIPSPQTRTEIVAELERVLRLLEICVQTEVWDRSGRWVAAEFERDDLIAEISLTWCDTEDAIEVRLEECGSPTVAWIYPWESHTGAGDLLADAIAERRREARS